MKIKKIRLSTVISDIYGRDGYQPYITVGREYWWFSPGDTNIFRTTGKYWNKIKVTYIRSGCMFYIFPDAPEVSEEFCSINCFLAASLEFAEIDPIKDLDGILEDDKVSRLLYCFNDDRTIVKNWPNEREIEVDEDKLFIDLTPAEYFLVKSKELK